LHTIKAFHTAVEKGPCSFEATVTLRITFSTLLVLRHRTGVPLGSTVDCTTGQAREVRIVDQVASRSCR
jgi:hypothetical protein